MTEKNETKVRVPERLRRAIRIAAAKSGLSMRDWLIDRLWTVLKAEIGSDAQ